MDFVIKNRAMQELRRDRHLILIFSVVFVELLVEMGGVFHSQPNKIF